MTTQQTLTNNVKRFLSNGLAGKDEGRTWMQHYAIRTGRAYTTNGHVLYSVDVPTVVDGEGYVSYDEDMKALEHKAPSMERLLPNHKARIDVRLDDKAVSGIRWACAAAQSISKALEQQWHREPKKTRGTSAATAAVRIEGGEYGLTVVVYSNNRCAFRQRVSDESVRGEFTVEIDADYLMDAVDALEEWSLHPLTLNVAPGGDSIEPVTLRHEGGPAFVLIMPRRI